jgi:hypothetical protein
VISFQRDTKAYQVDSFVNHLIPLLQKLIVLNIIFPTISDIKTQERLSENVLDSSSIESPLVFYL